MSAGDGGQRSLAPFPTVQLTSSNDLTHPLRTVHASR